MAQTLPGTGLSNLEPNSPGQSVTANQLFAVLSADFVKFRALDRDLTAPPGGESDGDAYIVAATATGTWAGHEDELAFYLNGSYLFFAPQDGWEVWVDDEGHNLTYENALWRSSGFHAHDIEAGLTATNAGGQGDTPLDPFASVHIFTAVGPASAAATLPATGITGHQHYVANRGSNALFLYPASGHSIDELATDAADQIASGDTGNYIATSATNWQRFSR